MHALLLLLTTLMLRVATSLALAFPLPEGLRQRNLDQEISRRESLEYLLDRDTFDSYDLEARAPLWPKKQPVVPTWPNLNTDRPTPQATFTMPVPLPRSPPKSGSPSPAANSHDPHHLD